jgi:hypothetical protein
VRNDLISDATSVDAGGHSFRLVDHAARGLAPGTIPAIPNAALHREANGDSVFVLDALAGPEGHDVSELDRVAIFKVFVPPTDKRNIKVEQWEFDPTLNGGAGDWVKVRWFTVSRFNFASILENTGELMCLAAEQGWSLHDTTPVGETAIFKNFEVRNAQGTTVAIVEKGKRGRNYVEIRGIQVNRPDGTVETLDPLDLSRPEGLPAPTADDPDPRIGYVAVESTINAIVETISSLEKLRMKGYQVDGSVDIVYETIGADTRAGAIFKLKIKPPMSLNIENEIEVKIAPQYSMFAARGVGDTYFRVIKGGIGRMTQIIEDFRAAYPTLGTIKIESQLRLMAVGSATSVNFGGHLLDSSISAKLELDLSKTAEVDDENLPGLQVSCVGITGTGVGLDLRLDPRSMTDAGLVAVVRTINGIVRSGVPVGTIKSGIEAANGAYGSSQSMIIKAQFGSGRVVAYRVGEGAQPRITFQSLSSIGDRLTGRNLPTMMPTTSLFESMFSRAAMTAPFTAYMDYDTYHNDPTVIGNDLGVRFDQWLVHHLLGDEYPPGTTKKNRPKDTPIQEERLKLACQIAGIAVDASGVPIQSLENDLVILRWFLLYAYNAGNRARDQTDNPVSLKSWLATHLGDSSIAAMDDEAFRVYLLGLKDASTGRNDLAFTYLMGFGLDEAPGGGHIHPHPPPSP